jgi:acyl-CoA synthetase (NDP forming)
MEGSGEMLDALFNPKAIAVIGASDNPRTIGHIVLKNLVDQGYRRPLYPINPKSPAVLGLPAHKSVLEVPGEVDLANIAIKNTLVPLAIEECGRKGVKFAIVHTAGFRESGEAGAALERQVVEIAHKYGMRVYGPNSQGVENSDPEARVYANFTFTPLQPGGISILAQSGGVGEVLQLHLAKLGAGFRMYASYGNECDVSLNEILAYYGQDAGTKVILLHVETLRDPVGFLEVAERITREKPILAVKSGRTREGLKAVSSHTGALMEKDVTSDVIFAKAGIQRFATQEEMIQTAIALAGLPLPPGRRVAMITNTGGPAILAVDETILGGLKMAQLSPATTATLRAGLHPEAAVGNPVDILATATPEHYELAIAALMQDPNVDAILISFITAQFVDLDGIAATLAGWGRKATKPLACVIMTIPKWQRLIDTIRAGGIPVYEFPETAARAVIGMARYAERRRAPAGEYPDLEVDRAAVARIFDRCPAGFISQADAFAVLAAYGIAVAKTWRVERREDLPAALSGLTFPLVLKVDAVDIVHKSDVGGIAMGIGSEAEAAAALTDLSARFAAQRPAFIVQEQLGRGLETIIGVNNTEGVAPIIMFGLGGILVEAIKDVVFRLAPLSRQDAVGMIAALKGQALLAGARGQPGADVESLIEMLLRVSRLATDYPRIAELDLNPVLSFGPGGGSQVVDVRIRLHERG